MTQLVCDVHKILDEGPVDGVIRISAAHTQYAGTSLMVPEFEDKELIAGKATFDNVEPGRAVVQIHWGFNSQVTLRVSIPDTETVLLSTLALQDYDFEPVIVGEVTKQANEAVASMKSALNYLELTKKESEEAEGHSADAERFSNTALQHREGAKAEREGAESAASDAYTYRQGALTYREGSKDHRTAAEAARTGAETARDRSEDYRDGSKAHREATKVSEDNAAASAAAANTSANTASTKATEISSKLQQALDAISSAESIEDDLRALMADTEAWQNVINVLEGVDADIAAAMELVKEEILGGVGPAFDTLQELAEALGDNADAIGTLTNELAKKSEKGHTHKSADITDAYYFTGGSMKDRVVKTYTDGHIFSASDPSRAEHLARKAYVDDEVAKKSDTGHTHTISNVSGLQSSLDGKAPKSHVHSMSEVDGLDAALAARSADGHKHEIGDVNGLATDLDNIRDHVDGQGASIIPFNSRTGKQRWADYLTVEYDPEAPTGRYYYNGPGWSSGRGYFFEVDPDVEYYASMWIKADKPGSRIYIELRDQSNAHAVQSGNLNGGSQYLITNYAVPTEWTKLESNTFKFKEGVHRAQISSLYFNHANGTERDANQMLTDIQLIPIPKLASKDIKDASYQIGSNYVKGTVVTAHPTNGDIYRYGTAAPSNSAALVNQFYVDKEVAKKSDTGHTHDSTDISDAVDLTTAGTVGKLVKVSGTGNIQSYLDPVEVRDLTRKYYVDRELNKKANTNHTHTSTDVDGTLYVGDGELFKVVKTGNDGHIHARTNPTSGNHLARKTYVDQEVSKKSDTGHKHTIEDITGYPGHTVASGTGTYGKIPVREADSDNIRVQNAPKENYHVVTKAYVDTRTPQTEIVTAFPSSPDPNTVYYVI